jgi:hypothetical protein
MAGCSKAHPPRPYPPMNFVHVGATSNLHAQQLNIVVMRSSPPTRWGYKQKLIKKTKKIIFHFSNFQKKNYNSKRYFIFLREKNSFEKIIFFENFQANLKIFKKFLKNC